MCCEQAWLPRVEGAHLSMTPARGPKQAIFLPFWRVLGRGTGPRGEKMVGRSRGTDSQDLATILDPFRVIFVDLRPDRQMSAVETGPMSAAETGQMSAAETGQMSAAETGQMSAAETRQMSAAET